VIKTSDIIKKLVKLADKLDEMGMISEADRVDTISKLLAPGEAWSCSVDLDDIDRIDDGQFLNTVSFSGILKLSPSQEIAEQVKRLSEELPDEAIMLGDDKLHVTLIHQSILKPYRKEIKRLFKEDKFPQFSSSIQLEDELIEKTNDDLGRKSWRLNVKGQGELQDYVNSVMELLGGGPNPEDRMFHVTIANLTGNPGDSVA